jgi:hypothetical protein
VKSQHYPRSCKHLYLFILHATVIIWEGGEQGVSQKTCQYKIIHPKAFGRKARDVKCFAFYISTNSGVKTIIHFSEAVKKL